MSNLLKIGNLRFSFVKILSSFEISSAALIGASDQVRHCCADITISHYYFCADNTPASRSELSAKVTLRISKAEAALRLALSGALPANKRAVRILEILIFSVSFLERSTGKLQ